MNYVCRDCAAVADVSTRAPRCSCGGLWSLDYRPPVFDMKLVDRSIWGLFRYRAFLPVEDRSWRTISRGEGMTPIVEFDPGLHLKMDYLMPTLSFKDRGAAVLVAHCASLGVDKVAQDSSGNAGASVAAYCGAAGIACEIFVPEGTSPKKIAMIRSYGANVTVVPGTRDHCAAVCRACVESEGIYYASHVFNPFFYEGTKTYIYEVFEQLGRMPRTLFIPVGNGTLFLGAIKGLEELLRAGLIGEMPHIVAVQSERCAPIFQARATGARSPVRVEIESTLAEGIAIGEPMRGRQILDSIYRYGIEVVTAPEAGIIEARNRLARRGVHIEHTTAATYAAYLRWRETAGEPDDCLLPMCGAGLKSEA